MGNRSHTKDESSEWHRTSKKARARQQKSERNLFQPGALDWQDFQSRARIEMQKSKKKKKNCNHTSFPLFPFQRAIKIMSQQNYLVIQENERGFGEVGEMDGGSSQDGDKGKSLRTEWLQARTAPGTEWVAQVAISPEKGLQRQVM